MLLGMLLQPNMQLFLLGQFAKAVVTPVGFEMLDRVPTEKPAEAHDSEDPMATQKVAA